MKNLFIAALILISLHISAQYLPKNHTHDLQKQADKWVNETYKTLTIEEKIGQLYIVALYTNKGEEHISMVRNLVEKEHIGGIILMQEDAEREINLVNEFQKKTRLPLLFGMDAEWGLYQRIKTAHKFPWALTLGAIQNHQLIYEMASKIATDLKMMGVYWNFAPVVDVNTNPYNPIIGNRSFGSEVENVVAKSSAYARGLQDQGVLAAIKHFPGHGDTDVDSHHDLPVVNHSIDRLNKVELRPFRELIKHNIGGVMVAHLYIPALEKEKGVPASVSHNIISQLLKKDYQYKGLVITDALNMNAVAKKYSPGELDLKAFQAGNDVLLFSQDVPTGKQLIKEAIEKGNIPQERLEESVKRILKTKYLLGLNDFKTLPTDGIGERINNTTHHQLSEKLYAHALTLIKNDAQLLPLEQRKQYYYVPLEEAPYQDFLNLLSAEIQIKKISKNEITNIPKGSTVIIGLHKDNSTAYKPYKISTESKNIIAQLSKNNSIILNVFGSPYALKDLDIKGISTVLISYENNEWSMKATAKAYLGKTKIQGRLPVVINNQLKATTGIDLNIKN